MMEPGSLPVDQWHSLCTLVFNLVAADRPAGALRALVRAGYAEEDLYPFDADGAYVADSYKTPRTPNADPTS